MKAAPVAAARWRYLTTGALLIAFAVSLDRSAGHASDD